MHFIFTLLLAICALAPLSEKTSLASGKQPETYLQKFPLESVQKFLRIYSSHSISKTHHDVSNLAVIVHGAGRNADEYFQHALEAASKKGSIKKPAIIAPRFTTEGDDGQLDREVQWISAFPRKWKSGGPSLTYEVSGKKMQTYAFNAMTKLLKHLTQKKGPFPNLKNLTIFGHSAGGQFVQRFAIYASDMQFQVSPHFIVSNPSSYMFLDSKRVSALDWSIFEPSLTECEGFNQYPYGSIGSQDITGRQMTTLVSSYLKQNVTYLISDQDKDLAYLDRYCEANLQGIHRLNRADMFFYLLEKHFPEHQHRIVYVPNTGHDHEKIFHSHQGQSVIFGNGSLAPDAEQYGELSQENSVAVSKALLLSGGKGTPTEGFSWLTEHAKGGDALVLAVKKVEDKYNQILMNTGNLNSSLTFEIRNRAIAFNKQLIKAVEEAEVLFFPGGNQSKYFDYLQDTPVLNAIQQKITEGKLVYGGVSAGLAVIGNHMFTGRNGTVSSSEVLENPTGQLVDIQAGLGFVPFYENLITDSHFYERDRMGRLLGFMARVSEKSESEDVTGIAVDEKTALGINARGTGSVFGQGFLYLVTLDSKVSWDRLKQETFSASYRIQSFFKGSQMNFATFEFSPVRDYKIVVTQGKMRCDLSCY